MNINANARQLDVNPGYRCCGRGNHLNEFVAVHAGRSDPSSSVTFYGSLWRHFDPVFFEESCIWLMSNNDYGWSVTISDDQWWSLMINDDHWWSKMITDDQWWSMMITHLCLGQDWGTKLVRSGYGVGTNRKDMVRSRYEVNTKLVPSGYGTQGCGAKLVRSWYRHGGYGTKLVRSWYEVGTTFKDMVRTWYGIHGYGTKLVRKSRMRYRIGTKSGTNMTPEASIESHRKAGSGTRNHKTMQMEVTHCSSHRGLTIRQYAEQVVSSI